MANLAILFDFDGTLTRAGTIDFSRIREALRCPAETPILEFIASIPSTARRKSALETLHNYEMEAAIRSLPNVGAEETLQFLRGHAIKVGIISRNSTSAIRCALDNFSSIGPDDFDILISRDDAYAPKPSPEAIVAAAGLLNVSVEHLIVVGDYILDIEAGRRAGAFTVFLTNCNRAAPCKEQPDYVIDELPELMKIARLHLPLPDGKLPNDLLSVFLAETGISPGPALVGPAVGEDVAAVGLQGEEVLVMKSDPVTFATDDIARYAVTVNVNDIATSGASPRWLLTTLMFPGGTRAYQIRNVMAQLHEIAAQQGLTLCGGHTEITGAVTRPIVAAQAVGTVSRSRLIDKRNMRERNQVLMTKRVSVEGTSIIAREFGDDLRKMGVSADLIERCRQFLAKPGISILPEARIAAQFESVTGMHDVTEGGLATALEEFSQTGGHRIRVYMDRIPYLEETLILCRLLDLHPLGLIGSGSLLISCDKEEYQTLLQRIRDAGIEATCIAEVLGTGVGIEAVSQVGVSVEWPSFEVDEIARLFRRMRPPKDGPDL
jgi:hydrogenase expression/formation protein HypE